MKLNYKVPTGIILKEYLDEINIDEKDLASIIGIDEKYLNELFLGKRELTEQIASELPKILPEIPASYWLNLENKYNEYMKQENSIDIYDNESLKEIAEKFKFKEVFNGLGWDIKKQAREMLKLLNIKKFGDFKTEYAALNVAFFEDGGESEAIAIWINLCKEEVYIQNDDLDRIKYSKENLIKNLGLFKNIAYNNNLSKTIVNCRKLCNRLGIYFVELEAIKNSKVRGALLNYDGHPAIFISGRFKTHDHIWFAIAHELGHLVKHYSEKNIMISLEDSDDDQNSLEEEANEFARNLFIEKSSYNQFTTTGDFSKRAIEIFAAQNKVLPGMVVARLQHDKYIKMNVMNSMKIK